MAGGLLLIDPGLVTDIMGALLAAAVVVNGSVLAPAGAPRPSPQAIRA